MTKIGIDFDNTIVCYDEIFYQVACERGLVPAKPALTKEGVRNYLRSVGQEDAWTELQGYVYGARMIDVAPFPGVLDFFARAVKKVPVCIISHKTRQPYSGPQYNLHEAAYNWLEVNGFFDKSRIGLSTEEVFFEETKEGKLEKIASKMCSHFIDDLPEFLLEMGFPDTTKRFLFSPNLPLNSPAISGLTVFRSWNDICNYFELC